MLDAYDSIPCVMESTKPIDHNDIQPQEAEKHRLGYMDVYAPVLPTKTQSQALKLISSVATWTCHDAEHMGWMDFRSRLVFKVRSCDSIKVMSITSVGQSNVGASNVGALK
jgi:hypothetical protein